MDDKGLDEALIEAALDGSAQAWERLVRRHERRVYNFGLRLTGNPVDALDLVQEVFLGVYRNLHRYRGDARFSSWLFRIAHNKAVDLSRKRRLVPIRELQGLDESEQDYERVADQQASGPEQALVEEQRRARLLSLMQALPWEQRLVLELKLQQSLTFEEIAEMQGISANTAKTRFYAALRKMKPKLESDHEL